MEKAKDKEQTTGIYKTKNKGKCLPLAQDDLTAIVDTIIYCSMERKGRPAEYPNNAEGMELFNNKTIEYFAYVNELNKNAALERQLIPDIENWCVYLGITRQTVFNYERRSYEWQQCIQYYKNAIASIKKQLMMHYKIPPMIAVFDLANNHDYKNTSEFKINTDNTMIDNEQKELESLEQKASEYGLKWNALTQSYE